MISPARKAREQGREKKTTFRDNSRIFTPQTAFKTSSGRPGSRARKE
jgi:hypothetical protein